MHATIHDSLNAPDSIEWQHRRHRVRLNGWPQGLDDAYLIWDGADTLIGEAPSLRAAQRLIDQATGSCSPAAH